MLHFVIDIILIYYQNHNDDHSANMLTLPPKKMFTL